VVTFGPVKGFLYKRKLGRLRVPNLAPDPVLATAAAMARFGGQWKSFYLHTCWAFDRLSARCDRAIAAAAPDAIIQAGCLFAPGRARRVPYYLYCDHTRALNERYPVVPGLEPPIPYEPAWRCREADVYRGATGIFAMSEHVKRSLTGTYRVDPARIHVVGAGPNATPSALGAGAPGGRAARRHPKVFLFVGKDFARKGGPELLAAFRQVRSRHPDAELWMVGGHQPGGVPPRGKRRGGHPRPQAARLYERAGVFVLPTVREPFGLAFLEAMSFGLPCIGTRIEAIPEIVVDGVTGRLVPPRDVPALARAMLELLEGPARARAMGEAGRARVARRFGWDRAVGRMLRVVERGEARFVEAAPTEEIEGDRGAAPIVVEPRSPARRSGVEVPGVEVPGIAP
jgi:glycosyltransferase involved in cell wall biosynthesis